MRKTVREVHQHADERHDLSVGREHGRPQTHSRGPGRDGRRAQVGRADAGELPTPRMTLNILNLTGVSCSR